MNTRPGLRLRARWMLLTLAGALTCAVAFGADKPAAAEARATYERELAVCKSNQSNQERATCLREANAAYAEARRSGLTGDPAQLRRQRAQTL